MSRNQRKPTLISVVGPTAVGKTELAIQLARHLGAVIVSADSRQFYREMEIGTAKPSKSELAAVEHHFINSHSIQELYSAGQFGRDAMTLLAELFLKNDVVVAVGGSSLYLKALWEGFDEVPSVDPEIRAQLNESMKEHGLEPLLKELKNLDHDYYEEVDRNNGQRVIRALEVIRGTGKKFSSFRSAKQQDMPYHNLKIGLNMDRDTLFDRINTRMDQMIEEGLFQEAEHLIPYRDHNALQTVGYKEIFEFLDGQYDKEEAVRLLKRNSRRYAKRQLTWFNQYDDIEWFEPQQTGEIEEYVDNALSAKS